MKITVLLQKQGTGVVAFETPHDNEVDATREAMNEAFRLFPESKFALFGFSKTDGRTTITTTRYLGTV